MTVVLPADAPFFSVVMPLYNKRPFVRRTLETVLAQRHASFEVIIVDDGSTDGSAAVIADLVGGRVRLIDQPNAGPSAARNNGGALALGAWLAFIDADDLWTPGHLDALARIAAAQPDARVVATTSRQLPADRLAGAATERLETAIRTIDYFADRGEDVVHTSSVAVARDAFARSGGFGPFCPGEDEELWSRLALDEPFAVSDAVTSTYLRDNQGIMDQVAGERRVPVTVATSPVGATLRAALADPTCADRHAAIRAYLRRLNMRDARICLHAGHGQLARRSLRAAGRPGSVEQALYWPLALLPRAASMRLARLWPVLRSRLRGRVIAGRKPAL